MKKIILTLVLGLAAVGIVAATPTQAKAFWPNGSANGFRVGPYSYMNVYGSTMWRYTQTRNAPG